MSRRRVSARARRGAIGEPWHLVQGFTRRSLLPHRLPPFLDKAFGASTGLVDVAIVGDPRSHAVRPHREACVAQLDVTGAARQAPALANREEHHPAAEVNQILGLY